MKHQTTLAPKFETAKKLRGVYRSPEMHWVGNGFPVRSILNDNGLGRELSPFLLLDYAAPYDFPPSAESRGVGAHPHKGFETVTVVYQGELEHRDSAGGGGKIGPGDAQWMTAGSGVVHEEFHSRDFTRRGGVLEMVQLWVDLRPQDKTAKPGYQALRENQIPAVPFPDQAGYARVIAGHLSGRPGPAKTFTPLNLWDIRLNEGGRVELPLPDGHTTALLALSGPVLINGEREARSGDLAVFAREGGGVTLQANSDAKLLLLNGAPTDKPLQLQPESAPSFIHPGTGRRGAL